MAIVYDYRAKKSGWDEWDPYPKPKSEEKTEKIDPKQLELLFKKTRDRLTEMLYSGLTSSDLRDYNFSPVHKTDGQS